MAAYRLAAINAALGCVEHVLLHVEPVIRLRSPALSSMPCRSRCVLLASKRRYCWTLEDRFYAPISYPHFHTCISLVGISRLGDTDVRQFHHRVQLVERSRAGRHVGQHAAVQHRPCGNRQPAGIHRILRGSCAWPALRWRTSARLPHILAPGSVGSGRDRDLVRVRLDRLLDGHALFRLARNHCPFGRLAGPRLFTPSAVLSFRPALLFQPAGFCVWVGDSFRPVVLGYGSWLAVVRTDSVWPTNGWTKKAY